MQKEEAEPVGVHDGLAEPEIGASALISWAFLAAQPRPSPFGDALRSYTCHPPSFWEMSPRETPLLGAGGA